MFKAKSIPFSNWYHLFENFQASSQQLYGQFEESVKCREIPNIKISRIDDHEGSIFSAKREYLRIRWKQYIFDICAAPFGKSFFVSWWLGETPGTFKSLVFAIPWLGPLLVGTMKPDTYFQVDTAMMFQESIRLSVLDVLNKSLESKGLRMLSEAHIKPDVHGLFKK